MNAVGRDAASCAQCRFRRSDRAEIERRLPGLASFGSAYGASMAQSALCEVHDAWVSPQDGCSRFKALDE